MNYGEKQYPKSAEANLEANFDIGNWVPEQDFGRVVKESSPVDVAPVAEDQVLHGGDVAPAQIVTERAPEVAQIQKYDFGSHFNSGVLSEVRQVEKKLSETGAVSDFYEAVRGNNGMIEAAKKWKE